MQDDDDDNIDRLSALRVSFHEAGHAWVARALLGPAAKIDVTIRSATLRSGVTTYGKSRTSAMNAITMSASGRAAEQILLHLHDDNFEGHQSDRGDEDKIKQIRIAHGLTEDEVFSARARARMLIRANAAEVSLLANQLLALGRGSYRIN